MCLSNLAQDGENYDMLMNLDCREFMVLTLLDVADSAVQYYIMRCLLGLCINCTDKTPNMLKYLILSHYLEPILRCAVSSD